MALKSQVRPLDGQFMKKYLCISKELDWAGCRREMAKSSGTIS